MKRLAMFSSGPSLRWLAPLLLAAGCASTPAPSAPASCVELQAQVRQAEAERQAAAQQQARAWKAVLPVAVAARYANSQSASREAERQLAALRREATRQHCEID